MPHPALQAHRSQPGSGTRGTTREPSAPRVAYSLASLHTPAAPALVAPANGTRDPVRQRLHDRAAELVSFYDRIATQVGRVPHGHWPPAEVATRPASRRSPRSSWPPRLLCVHEHLKNLSEKTHTISGPAVRVAELRRTPWWR